MIRISWSGLRVHEECKQKSFQARAKKTALLDDKRNFLPGTITDLVVRRWLTDDPLNNLGVMPDMVEAAIDLAKSELVEKGEGVVRWRDPGDRKAVLEECQEAVSKIEPHLLKYVVPFRFKVDYHFKAPVHLINPVTKQEDSVVLNGYMDILVLDEQDRWWIWDVKHTRDESYWRKTVGQLGFYDLAIELISGRPSKQTGLMQPLCDQPVMPYTPTAASRAQLMQRIVGMANDIWLGDKTPRATSGSCNWCEVKHACEKYTDTVDEWNRKRASL